LAKRSLAISNSFLFFLFESKDEVFPRFSHPGIESRAASFLFTVGADLLDAVEAGDKVLAAVRESDDDNDDTEHDESFADTDADSGTEPELARARYLRTRLFIARTDTVARHFNMASETGTLYLTTCLRGTRAIVSEVG
jgi:hypothetical protein